MYGGKLTWASHGGCCGLYRHSPYDLESAMWIVSKSTEREVPSRGTPVALVCLCN